MAVDILFNFYEILVLNIFGTVFLSIVAFGMLLAAILMLCKSSSTLILYWTLTYFIVMFSFYLGSLGLLLGFLAGAGYFIWGVIKLISGE